MEDMCMECSKDQDFLSVEISKAENGYIVKVYGYDKIYTYVAKTNDEAKKIAGELIKK